MPDLPKPEKAEFPEFKRMELRILGAIWAKFLPKDYHEKDSRIVKEADSILLATEARDLMANMDDWAPLPEPLEGKIRPLPSRIAELAFLYRFRRYTEG